MAMYFAGELDRVQRREFDRLVDSDPKLAARFDEAYDERTESHGLMALGAAAPELSECYSYETLERYARDELDPEARAWVQAHLACPLCRAQVQALTEKKRSAQIIRFPARTVSLIGAVAASLVVGVVGLRYGQNTGGQGVGGPTESPVAYRATEAKRITATLALPNGLGASGGNVTAHNDGPTLILRARGKVFIAVAAGVEPSASRWVYPAPIAFGPRPNMTELKNREERKIRLDDVRAGEHVWLLTSEQQYNLDVVRSVSPGDDWNHSPEAVDVNVHGWSIVRK